jgi:hypothetical protein
MRRLGPVGRGAVLTRRPAAQAAHLGCVSVGSKRTVGRPPAEPSTQRTASASAGLMAAPMPRPFSPWKYS